VSPSGDFQLAVAGENFRKNWQLFALEKELKKCFGAKFGQDESFHKY
jgi:hypothetical protein